MGPRSGSTIAMTVLLLMMSSIVLAGLWMMFSQTRESQRTRRAHPHWLWFVRSVRNNIEDPMFCTQLLAGQVINLGNNAVSNINLNLPPLNVANNSIQMSGNVRFQSAAVRVRPVPPASGPAQRVRVVRSADPSVGTGPNGLLASWRAHLFFRANAHQGAPPPDIDQPDYQIPIVLNVRPSGGATAVSGNATIVSCGIQGSMLEACEQLGGFYDSRVTPYVAAPESRCLPYRRSSIMPCPATVNPPFTCNNGLWNAPVGTTLPASCSGIPLNPVRYFPVRIGLQTLSVPQQIMFQCRWDNPNIPAGGDPTP